MITKHDIIKMAKHVFRRSRGMPDRRLLHPKRDWLIGMLMFATILIAGSIVSAQTFVSYQDVLPADDASVGIIPTYNSATIEKVLEEYRARTILFSNIETQQIPEEIAAEDDAATSTQQASTTPEVDLSTSTPQQEM